MTSRKSKGGRQAAKGLQGRRFTDEQRKQALTLIAGGMQRIEVAKAIGTTTESLRRWVAEASSKGVMPAGPSRSAPAALATAPAVKAAADQQGNGRLRSPYAPADPAQGLGEHEVAAILDYKRKHPSMGPAQIRTQLKRFKGWRVSITSHSDAPPNTTPNRALRPATPPLSCASPGETCARTTPTACGIRRQDVGDHHSYSELSFKLEGAR